MIDIMFMSLLYHVNLAQHKNSNSYFYNKVLDLKRQYQENDTGWLCDTFNTNNIYDLMHDPNFVPILKNIQAEVLKFSKEFGVDTSIEKIKCTDAWLNLATPTAYQEYHIHGGSHFSIVYYIKVPENGGNLVFRSHESATDMLPLPRSNNQTAAEFKTFGWRPEENDLVIFRSNMMHMVTKNYSQENRVSISANFVVQE